MSKLVKKDIFHIIGECAKSEDFIVNDLEVDDLKSELKSTFDGIPEIEPELFKTDPDMIVVRKIEMDGEEPIFAVELEEMVKLIESQDLSIDQIEDAIDMVSDVHNLDPDCFVMVVDSEDFVDCCIDEAKSSKLGAPIKRIKDTLDVINMLKTKGLKIIKKKK